MSNIFGTRYPIVCSAMNKLSDANLAIAAHRAGCLPCLLYSEPKEIYKFLNETGSTNFSIFINNEAYESNPNFAKEIVVIQPAFVERVAFNHHNVIDMFKQDNIKIITRTNIVQPKTVKQSDIIYLKGSESAGAYGSMTAEELINAYKELTDLPLIVSGAIDSPAKVKHFLSQGASAVVVGSLFAASAESKLDIKIKKQICELTATSLNTEIMPDKRTIVIDQYQAKDPYAHNHDDLVKGIQGQKGHVFFSETINSINRIMTVSEIVQFLMYEYEPQLEKH